MKGGSHSMKGHEIINHIAREEMPDIENIRENLHANAKYDMYNKIHTRMRAKRFIPIVISIALLLAISTTVLAFYGGFDGFIHRVNPPFAEIITPVMDYAEDQGIRITLIGARQFDTNAVLYLSMHDTTGENRITQSACIFGCAIDGALFASDAGGAQSGGMSFYHMFFDRATNTRYIQLMIQLDQPLTGGLTLTIPSITLERRGGWCDELQVFDETVLHGHWQVTAYPDDVPVGSDTAEIRFENLIFDIYGVRLEVSLTINPISIQVDTHMTYDPSYRRNTHRYTWPSREPLAMYVHRQLIDSINIETTEDIATIRGGSGWGGSDTPGIYTVEVTLWAQSLLNLDTITAVIINGERFPVN